MNASAKLTLRQRSDLESARLIRGCKPAAVLRLARRYGTTTPSPWWQWLDIITADIFLGAPVFPSAYLGPEGILQHLIRARVQCGFAELAEPAQHTIQGWEPYQPEPT